jgi:hypothetical protein
LKELKGNLQAIMVKNSLLIFVLLITGANSFSQENTDLSGVWKGTSICKIKDSPCADEIAVYHFRKTDDPDIYHITMNKMAGNKEIVTGALDCTYDSLKHTLISENEAGTWSFKINGLKLEGTLIYNEQLYRIINLKKEN